MLLFLLLTVFLWIAEIVFEACYRRQWMRINLLSVVLQIAVTCFAIDEIHQRYQLPTDGRSILLKLAVVTAAVSAWLCHRPTVKQHQRQAGELIHQIRQCLNE